MQHDAELPLSTQWLPAMGSKEIDSEEEHREEGTSHLRTHYQ